MNALVLACGVLLATGPASQEVSSADLQDYEAAKAQAKRDPAAHVRLALWCESHGLEAQRLKHLAIALLTDPQNASARGLLGLVSYKGQWRRPADVAVRLQDDPALATKLAEYNAKRTEAANTPDAQWRVAIWCEENGLQAEALAHFTAVTRLDPTREAAWKRLGCTKYHGRWLNEAQIAAVKAEATAQKQANAHWKPLLEKYRRWLTLERKRKEATRWLTTVADPRAVPAINAVFCSGSAADQARAVQLLGQIDAPGASRSLARLVFLGRSPEVRRQAAEALRRRDAREFAHLVIALVRDPIKFAAKPVGPDGTAGELLIKGKEQDVKRIYAAPIRPASPYVEVKPGDVVFLDEQGRPVIYRHETYEMYVGTLAPFQPGFGPFLTSGFQDARAKDPSEFPGGVQVKVGGVLMHAASPVTQFLANYWQADLSGFGAWDSGFNTFDLGNFVMLPYGSSPRGHQAASQPIRLTQGPAGERNQYFVFGRDVYIEVDKLLSEGGRPDVGAAQQQLQMDIAQAEQYNSAIRASNEQACTLLRDVSGLDLGSDREAWNEWYTNQMGYVYLAQKNTTDKPTIVQEVPVAARPSGVVFQQTSGSLYQRISCFGAGTLVQTISGKRPIESLAVGDQVLTQDTKTGALSYQPILVVHHNPPSKTFRITLGDEPVISSEFHRFWKAGRGWVMARDLKVGDTIRTLDGLVRVTEFETDVVQPVYNLDIAETGSFFVGQQGALVHDNTLPAPVTKPFDAEPVLAAKAGARVD